MSGYMFPVLSVQIRSAVHVTVVLAQACAYVWTRLVGGESCTYAQNSRRKVVSEADVTSAVSMLPYYERIVRLVALFPCPELHARGQPHVHHVVDRKWFRPFP